MWILLPARLHTPLLADTREPLSRIVMHASGIDAAIGDGAALVGVSAGDLAAQLGLSAGVFMGFVPGDALTFHLETFDGIFSIPVDVRWRQWEARVQLAHLSAHFADGIRQTGYAPTEAQRDPFSREWLGLNIGRHAVAGPAHLYPYLGGQWIYHAVDDGGGVGVAGGAVVEREGAIGPYGAVDLSTAAELDWAATLSGELGVQLRGAATVRIALVGYTGRNDAGKKIAESERYLGLQVSIASSP